MYNVITSQEAKKQGTLQSAAHQQAAEPVNV